MPTDNPALFSHEFQPATLTGQVVAFDPDGGAVYSDGKPISLQHALELARRDLDNPVIINLSDGSGEKGFGSLGLDLTGLTSYQDYLATHEPDPRVTFDPFAQAQTIPFVLNPLDLPTEATDLETALRAAQQSDPVGANRTTKVVAPNELALSINSRPSVFEQIRQEAADKKLASAKAFEAELYGPDINTGTGQVMYSGVFKYDQNREEEEIRKDAESYQDWLIKTNHHPGQIASELEEHLQKLQTLSRWKQTWSGVIPDRWRDWKNISDDLERAIDGGIQLSSNLITTVASHPDARLAMQAAMGYRLPPLEFALLIARQNQFHPLDFAQIIEAQKKLGATAEELHIAELEAKQILTRINQKR